MNCSVVRLRIGISKASIRLWASWTACSSADRSNWLRRERIWAARLQNFSRTAAAPSQAGGTGTEAAASGHSPTPAEDGADAVDCVRRLMSPLKMSDSCSSLAELILEAPDSHCDIVPRLIPSLRASPDWVSPVSYTHLG